MKNQICECCLLPIKGNACENDVCNAANGLPYTTYGLAGIVKTFAIIAGLFAVVSVGCAAPPYVPQPPQNFTGLAFSPSPDPSVTGYWIKAFKPTDTAWQNVGFTTATNIPNILTNYPSGTAFCITATNAVAESLPSNQYTNNIVVAPAAPAALTAK